MPSQPANRYQWTTWIVTETISTMFAGLYAWIFGYMCNAERIEYAYLFIGFRLIDCLAPKPRSYSRE